MGKIKIEVPRKQISKFCKKWKVRKLSLFGSVLSDSFQSNSDIDVLITLDEGTTCTLFDLVRMQNELKEIFGREVDIISRRGIESSKNYIRRNAILASAEAVYGS